MPDGSIFCSKCGSKLDDIANEEEENINQKIDADKKEGTKTKIISGDKKINLKQKRIMLFAIVGIALIIGSIVGYKCYDKNKKIKEAAKYHQQYEVNFAKTTLNILTEDYLCGQMCEQISDTWRNAIDASEDFNTKLSDLHSQWDSNGALKERETAKNNIEKNMKKLQNPPKDYEEAYKLFVDLYSTYGQIYSQATSPNGSLVSYNQDVEQKESAFNQLYDKIKVIEPNIESIGKKK